MLLKTKSSAIFLILALFQHYLTDKVYANEGTSPRFLSEVVATLPIPPRTLLPSKILDSYTTKVASYIFEPLFYDNGSEFSSNVFSTWSQSADGFSYSFVLKPGKRFHDGQPVTIEDLEYTVKEAFATKKTALSFVHSLQSISSNSKDTLTLTLSKRTSLVIPAMADPKLSLVPKDLHGHSVTDFDKNPIGSGPYRLIEKNSKETILERVDKGSGVQRLRFITVTSETFPKLLKSTTIHDPNFFPFDPNSLQALRQLAAEGTYQTFVAPQLKSNIVAFNFRKSLLQDLKIRQFLYELFRDPKNLETFSLPPIIAAGGFVPEGMRGHRPNLNSNVDSSRMTRLKSLYEKAFTDNRIVTIDLTLLDVKPRTDKVKSLTQEWKKIFPKVEIVVRALTAEKVLNALDAGDFSLLAISWGAEFSHPFFFLQACLQDSNVNLFGIRAPRIESMLREYTGKTKAEDTAFFSKIDQYIEDEALIIPLTYSRAEYFFPRNITGYTTSILGPKNIGLSQITKVPD